MECITFIRASALSGLLLALALPAGAAPAAAQMSAAQQRVADEVEQFLVEQVQHLGGEPSVFVTPPTQTFDDCDMLDVYLPAGRKIASKTTVAVRCLGGEGSPSYVRADVQVEGAYYVPSQSIAVNQAISPDLLESRSGDLLRLPANTVTDASSLIGRIATQRLQPGRPVRIGATRSSESIQRGQTVRIEVQAPGLVVTNQGEAMSTAEVGASIQVKTRQGKLIQAVVKENGVVTVPL